MAIDETKANIAEEIAAPPFINSMEMPKSVVNRTVDSAEKLQRNLVDDIVKEINLEEPNLLKSDDASKPEVNYVLQQPSEEKDQLSIEQPQKWLTAAKSTNVSQEQSKNDINSEALMREDQEIALDEEKELEKTKDLLIEQVQEIKDEMKKQHKETQHMVNKLEEIVNKVEHIEAGQKKSAEKITTVESPKMVENPIINMLIKNHPKANVSTTLNGKKLDNLVDPPIEPNTFLKENVRKDAAAEEVMKQPALERIESKPVDKKWIEAAATDKPSVEVVTQPAVVQIKPTEEKHIEAVAGHGERELLSINEQLKSVETNNGAREKRNADEASI